MLIIQRRMALKPMSDPDGRLAEFGPASDVVMVKEKAGTRHNYDERQHHPFIPIDNGQEENQPHDEIKTDGKIVVDPAFAIRPKQSRPIVTVPEVIAAEEEQQHQGVETKKVNCVGNEFDCG